MVAIGWMPSCWLSSTGRRIERFSISQSTMKPSRGAERRRRRRRAAISSRGGLTGVFCSIGASIRVKRWPLESTSICSPTWAWPSEATALSYWRCRLSELALEVGEGASRCAASPGARRRGRRASSRPPPARRRCSSSCSSIGASSTSSSESGCAASPSAPGTARAACCSATRLSSAAMRVCSTRICGLLGLVDRLLLQELALQVLQLLLLGARAPWCWRGRCARRPRRRWRAGSSAPIPRAGGRGAAAARAPAGRGGCPMLSGSAATLAVLKSAIFFDCSASAAESRSTSPWKKSRVSLARSVRMPHVLLQDQRDELVGALGGELRGRREEGDADDGRARRAGPDRRIGLRSR